MKCETCGREFKAKIGLISHQRKCKPVEAVEEAVEVVEEREPINDPVEEPITEPIEEPVEADKADALNKLWSNIKDGNARGAILAEISTPRTLKESLEYLLGEPAIQADGEYAGKIQSMLNSTEK